MTVQDFDGITIGSNRLLASFAVQDGTTAKILVWISTDKGETWSGPITAREFSNAFFSDCPVLTSQYDRRLGGFSSITSISSGTTANVYFLTSTDGNDWTSTMLGGEDLPTECEGD